MSKPPPLDPAVLAGLAEGLASPGARALLGALPAPWGEALAALAAAPPDKAPRLAQEIAQRLSKDLDPAALHASLGQAMGPAVASLAQGLRALEGALAQQRADGLALRAELGQAIGAQEPDERAQEPGEEAQEPDEGELARAWSLGLEVLAEAEASEARLAAVLRGGRGLGRSLQELLDGLQRPNAHKQPATEAKARQLQRQAERLAAQAAQASPAGLVRRMLPLVEAWSGLPSAPSERARLLGVRAALWEVAARLGELKEPGELERAWAQAWESAEEVGDEDTAALALRRAQAAALDAQDWEGLAALARRFLARFPVGAQTPTESAVELALSLWRADPAQAEALLRQAEADAPREDERERAALALAQLDDQAGRLDEAERRWWALQARSAGARPRTEAHAWQGLAGVCAQRGAWEEAAARYARAWGLAREVPDFVLFARSALGWVFALDALGQRAQAVEALVASRAFLEPRGGAQAARALEEAKDELCRRWGDAAFVEQVEALRARVREARGAPSEAP